MGAEVLLALVAGAAFLGFLGSTELWGKHKQRASAEALDTVNHGHGWSRRSRGILGSRSRRSLAGSRRA